MTTGRCSFTVSGTSHRIRFKFVLRHLIKKKHNLLLLICAQKHNYMIIFINLVLLCLFHQFVFQDMWSINGSIFIIGYKPQGV
jgi:hypothetical protein